MPDPPILPYADSTTWFESGPESLLNAPDEALLIVRVGMAANAIAGQLRVAAAAKDSPGAARHRDLMLSLVGSAAIIHESIKLIKHNRNALLSLANAYGVDPDVVAEVTGLCDGTHPANALVERARNQVGFHWEAAAIGASLEAYRTNENIVWLEVSAGQLVNRLATEVMGHVLLGSAASQRDPRATILAVYESLVPVWGALKAINAVFVAAIYGYMQRHGIEPREREDPPR